MKMTTKILEAFTAGIYTASQANTELERIGANVRVDPDKHKLTPEEIQVGSAGLLDTGTGTLDKVKVDPIKMELVNCDCGNMYALCTVKGRTYKVDGVKLYE